MQGRRCRMGSIGAGRRWLVRNCSVLGLTAPRNWKGGDDSGLYCSCGRGCREFRPSVRLSTTSYHHHAISNHSSSLYIYLVIWGSKADTTVDPLGSRLDSWLRASRQRRPLFISQAKRMDVLPDGGFDLPAECTWPSLVVFASR